MTNAGSKASLETFEKVEIDYERAYGHNPLKIACLERAIPLLPSDQPVLDVGCGTGKPVAEILTRAGFEVTGVDISAKMIQYARDRVKGTYITADLLDFQPDRQYGAVFIIFSLLQLSSWSDFETLMMKYALAVQDGGYLIYGSMPSDNYVKEPEAYDQTGTYAVDYKTPFMGEMKDTFFLTSKGTVDYISSLGFTIVSNEVGVFHPNDQKCVPEDQQYIIAQRTNSSS